MSFEAEEQVYVKYADGLIRYATVLAGPELAEDVVAEAVQRVLRRGGLVDVSNSKAYLYRAVHNTAVTVLGRVGARPGKERDAALLEAVAHLGESDIDVHRAVAALSPRQRAVVWLTYWDDLTITTVADILEISEGSVKRHLARARAAVRKALE